MGKLYFKILNMKNLNELTFFVKYRDNISEKYYPFIKAYFNNSNNQFELLKYYTFLWSNCSGIYNEIKLFIGYCNLRNNGILYPLFIYLSVDDEFRGYSVEESYYFKYKIVELKSNKYFDISKNKLKYTESKFFYDDEFSKLSNQTKEFFNNNKKNKNFTI